MVALGVIADYFALGPCNSSSRNFAEMHESASAQSRLWPADPPASAFREAERTWRRAGQLACIATHHLSLQVRLRGICRCLPMTQLRHSATGTCADATRCEVLGTCTRYLCQTRHY